MNHLIIDVRDQPDYFKDHVPGAINITPYEFMKGAKQLENTPKNTKIIVYCYSGDRANVAINILRSMGFTNLINGINQDHLESNTDGLLTT